MWFNCGVAKENKQIKVLILSLNWDGSVTSQLVRADHAVSCQGRNVAAGPRYRHSGGRQEKRFNDKTKLEVVTQNTAWLGDKAGLNKIAARN